jgi:pimeloyl-ACP methyl ester carboxylesterase
VKESALTRTAEAFPGPPRGTGEVTGLNRFGRGLLSWLMIPFFLVGKWFGPTTDRLDDPALEAEGLTIVLTGILGRSLLEQQIALGIADAGVRGRIEIVDWTTGNPIRFLQHLRARHLAAQAAVQLAERIAQYRADRPDCPIRLVGYSGGGYVTLLILEALPTGVEVTHATVLAPSASPYLDLRPLAEKTQCGLSHFCSSFDFFVLGLVTTIVGTTDGWHSPAAGLVGFHPDGLFATASHAKAVTSLASQKYRQHRFDFRWLRHFHYGGHFGYANRVWACEMLGKVLADTSAIDRQQAK